MPPLADPRAASCSSISLSPPPDGGEGWGEEVRFYWFPLSSVLSPLVPRGERMENLMQPWPYECVASLRNNSHHRVPFGNEHRPVARAINFRVRVDPQQIINRRRQVVRADRIFARKGRGLVRFAMDETALDSAAGQQNGVTLRPMIAAGLVIDLRRAAELT